MWTPDRLRFGPAGIPHSTQRKSTFNGIMQVKALGLDAMEIEFVRRINLREEEARKAGEAARSADVVLTVHAPYYINLASPEEEKAEASIQRICQSAVIGGLAGAWSVCFHPAYYKGRSPEEVYGIVKRALERIVETLKGDGVEIWVRPETAGALSEFGSLEEVVRLSEELDMVLPVVDFAHIYARSRGEYNSYEAFASILDVIEAHLGREALTNMHMHVSGIEYGEKGERRHLNLAESKLRFRELLKALKDYGVRGVLICESPNLEEDAMLLRDEYRSL